MVDNVLKKLGKNAITRLNILDHGNPDGIQLGSDWITTTTLPLYSVQLSRLTGYFSSDGLVHLQHCEAGQNKDLLVALARAFGVPVYAGTGKHNSTMRFNLGHYVVAYPSGIYKDDVGRP
jgi:hypothetical protein